MPYQSIRELPQLIQDRIYLEEHTAFFDTFFKNGFVVQDKGGDLYDVLDSILLRQENVDNLSKLLMSKIGMTPENAERANAELWRGYLVCFQDYFEKIDDSVLQDSQKDEREKFVRTLFSVHRQLQDVIAPILYEIDLSECDVQCKDELKDIIIALATKMTPESEIKMSLENTLLRYNRKDVSVEKVFERFTEFIKEEFTAEVADYYVSLPDSILNGKQHSLLRKQIARSEGKQVVPEVIKEESIRDRAQKLPKEILDVIASPLAQEQRTILSKKYDLELEDLLYAIALKEVQFDHIPLELRKQRSINPELVAQIRDEIIKTFFEPVMWYFTGALKPGGEAVQPETKTEEKRGVSFPSPIVAEDRLWRESNDQAPVLVTESRVESGITKKEDEPRRVDSYEALANEVIQKCATLMSEDCRVRVERALITRIRNIRTNIETREKLISEMSQGGCGITDEQADCLTKESALLANEIQKGTLHVHKESAEMTGSRIESGMTDNKKSVVKEVAVQEKPEPPLPPPPPIVEEVPKPQDFSRMDPRSGSGMTKPPPSQKPAGLSIEEVDGIPTLVEKPAIQQKQAPIPQPLRVPLQKNESQVLKVEVRKTSTSPQDQKKLNVSDVKRAPHLVGPIDELQSFSMKDFRRISANPVQAANRIFDKVQSLEKESLTRKMEAIDAWKRSEVNQLYIEIGKESFGKGMPIAQAIEQRKNADKEFLTEAEFDALLDLNTMLRQ